MARTCFISVVMVSDPREKLRDPVAEQSAEQKEHAERVPAEKDKKINHGLTAPSF